MAGKLKRLSVPTHDALKLAACLGSSLDLDTLAIVARRPAEALRDGARGGRAGGAAAPPGQRLSLPP